MANVGDIYEYTPERPPISDKGRNLVGKKGYVTSVGEYYLHLYFPATNSRVTIRKGTKAYTRIEIV